MRWVALLLVSGFFVLAQAQTLSDSLAPSNNQDVSKENLQAANQERQRIQALREQIDPRFNADEAACYQRFAVSDCLTQVRRAKREAVADLRRQEVALNLEDAKRKGAEQLSRLEERAKQEPRQGEATAREQSNLQPQDRGRDNAQRAIDKAASNDPSKAAVERAKASARQVERLRERGEKAAAAARAKADLAQRTQDAAVRKAQQIQKLNEQKASKALPAKPLPSVMPPLAAASSGPGSAPAR